MSPSEMTAHTANVPIVEAMSTILHSATVLSAETQPNSLQASSKMETKYRLVLGIARHFGIITNQASGTDANSALYGDGKQAILTASSMWHQAV